MKILIYFFNSIVKADESSKHLFLICFKINFVLKEKVCLTVQLYEIFEKDYYKELKFWF